MLPARSNAAGARSSATFPAAWRDRTYWHGNRIAQQEAAPPSPPPSEARRSCALGFGVLAAALWKLLLPIAPVASDGAHAGHGPRVQAARVHAVSVRMRARHVEGFDATYRTEQVARCAGVELVGGESGGIAQQPEMRGGHDQVQVTALSADRAVAVQNLDVGRSLHLESHPPAMAAAVMSNHNTSKKLQLDTTRGAASRRSVTQVTHGAPLALRH